MIEKIHIDKFRAFQNVECELGSQLTAIAGRNGTQKTTLLGILTQPFTISKDNPMKGEKPLCGGNYKSDFANKFKLSPQYDKPGDHQWTLYFNDRNPFTVESIKRGQDRIRFWQKGLRGQGDGYIQFPVIFLSLKRLYPIGEDRTLKESSSVELKDDEIREYTKIHDDVLFALGENAKPDYIESSEKATLGVTTINYDWRSNSAGQDNLGKIILALFSFKRLKENYNTTYQGGILAIDELDTTFFPASQVKLIKYLRSYATKYNIQIIFTTHSLQLLEPLCIQQGKNEKSLTTKNQIKVLYLKKYNGNVEFAKNITYEKIKHDLEVTIGIPQDHKINVYTEDKENKLFFKSLMPSKFRKTFRFAKVKMGCTNYINLIEQKVPSFLFPDCIIVLDGDAQKAGHWKKIPKNNVILLPSNLSPEQLMAKFIESLNDHDRFWKSVAPGYDKTVCFKDIKPDQIMGNRETAKAWFQSQCKKSIWNPSGNKLFNRWKADKNNKIIVSKFKDNLETIINNIIEKRGMKPEDFM